MLTYSFEDIGNDTLYEHLYKAIKNDILNGNLTPMQKLPSKRSFAKNLSISTITVENAYSQLLAEGYIFSIPKKGYYVSNFSNPLLPNIDNKSDFHNT
ncbi:MAG: winged helix-turn-helix domain-containing protein, partial [Lachnospiraceae bacterium]|nr:winged helix-turn-helix domain-containing protein [Lachnospiraceae bacterium]